MVTKTPPFGTTILGSVASLALVLASACGGSTPPPTPAAAEALAPPESAAELALEAERDAAPPPRAEPASAPTEAEPGGPPASGGAEVVETKDECTPVGVDFEKRARPKLKACYAEGKKKNPNLEGTVKIKITVDVKGKIKTTKIIENTLTDPVGKCMLKAVKATPFPEVDKCWDATLTIPITFPTAG